MAASTRHDGVTCGDGRLRSPPMLRLQRARPLGSRALIAPLEPSPSQTRPQLPQPSRAPPLAQDRRRWPASRSPPPAAHRRSQADRPRAAKARECAARSIAYASAADCHRHRNDGRMRSALPHPAWRWRPCSRSAPALAMPRSTVPHRNRAAHRGSHSRSGRSNPSAAWRGGSSIGR